MDIWPLSWDHLAFTNCSVARCWLFCLAETVYISHTRTYLPTYTSMLPTYLIYARDLFRNIGDGGVVLLPSFESLGCLVSHKTERQKRPTEQNVLDPNHSKVCVCVC